MLWDMTCCDVTYVKFYIVVFLPPTICQCHSLSWSIITASNTICTVTTAGSWYWWKNYIKWPCLLLHIMQYLSWSLQGTKSGHWDIAWLWSIGDHIVVCHSYNTDKTDLPFVYAEHMYSVWAVLDYISYPSALLFNACFSLGEWLYWTIHVSSIGSSSILPLTIASHKLNRKVLEEVVEQIWRTHVII